MSLKTERLDTPPKAFGGEPEFPKEGSNLGPYEDLRCIGEGGQGRVYKAYEPSMKRFVALKVLERGARLNSDSLKRFENEYQTQGNLSIPGVATVYATGEDQGWSYFAMEYVEGLAIDEYIVMHDKDTLERVGLLAKLARILARLHAAGKAHRDIKPGNVMVTEDGEVKLLDLGLVKSFQAVAGAPVTQENMLTGTLEYLAPEAAAPKKSVSLEAMDVYSFGVMAFELLTGQLPYLLDHGTLLEALAIIQDVSPPPLRELNDAIPPDVERVILSALNKKPKRRPSMASIARDLDALAANEPLAPRTLSWKTSVASAGIAFVLAFCFIGAWNLLRRDEPELEPESEPVIDSRVAISPVMDDNEKISKEPDRVLKAETDQDQAAAPMAVANVDTRDVDSRNVTDTATENAIEIVTNFDSTRAPKPVVSELFIGSAPKTMERDWERATAELNDTAALQGKAALLYHLEPKAALTLIRDGFELIRVRAMVEPKTGCYFAVPGQPVTIKYNAPNRALAKRFTWTPEKGRVDAFRGGTSD